VLTINQAGIQLWRVPITVTPPVSAAASPHPALR
jgi:hypothetical protein